MSKKIEVRRILAYTHCIYMQKNAFRGAHTLKGVCLNLGFQKLYEVSAELTEALRDRELKGYEEQFAAVQKQYQITVEAIREWQQEQN